MGEIELSVVLPCRNEEKIVGKCIEKINEVLKKEKIDGEIIVSDSSTDGSAKIAEKMGACVVRHGMDGYGVAIREGINVARGKYIFIADCDGSYDFNEIGKFYRAMKEGADFVIGNRFSGRMENDAMPKLHKYVGNPLLSGIFRLFFGKSVRDVHCGMRAISSEAYKRLDLKTGGMEFAKVRWF